MKNPLQKTEDRKVIEKNNQKCVDDKVTKI